ncbi:digestive cysteine proteinase 1-like [Ischnura elegans]|uniref:digestive cysteine proteinase 1-like n=1 Tax=Ischnura elegans TaxID=197161 RepID=UPI001ED88CC0|nr:digestive cysteine proteinase 1-like [Ischnura elegans]
MLVKSFSIIPLGYYLLIGYCVCGHPSAYVGAQSDSVPVFSDKYTAKGDIYLPFADLREPFTAWYDIDSRSSRIDYYGDMVKTYQLGNFREFGTSRKVVPMTTETQWNVQTCVEVNGTQSSPVTPQGILPDLTGYKKIGSEIVNGVNCEKWRLVYSFEDKVNTYTMWVTYKEFNGVLEPVPIRYEVTGTNPVLGAHYDHYYLNYEDYISGSPDPDVFKLDESMTCRDFPGPGVDRTSIFNPMKEFIHNDDSHIKTSFEEFKQTHNKQYNDDEEHHHRLNVFRQNVRFISSKNRANLGFQLKVNHLADLTDEERMALKGWRYTGEYNGGLPFPEVSPSELRDIPSTLDWRIYGAVTPVKDQAVCGSCWSFTATGTVESAYFLKYGKQISLSQQALIDCTWGFGNDGCNGGQNYRAFEWMMEHGGTPTDAEYGPYLGQDGYCHANSTTLVAPITGYTNVTTDVDIFKYALATQGPISVSIDAGGKEFDFYSHGIHYNPTCGNKFEDLNHSILLVGYGEINGEPYLLARNSWSTFWGNDGYILMSPKDNNCGIMTMGTYVSVK